MITIIATLFLGYSQGASRQMIGGAIDNYLGTALLYHSASKQDPLWPESLVGFDASGVLEALGARTDWETRKQYRAKVFVYSGQNQQSLLLTGVEQQYLEKVTILAGTSLEEPNQILISAKTADKLAVEINDLVACEVITQDGRRNFDYLQVAGIYQILGLSAVMSNHMALTSLPTIQRLMNEPEDVVTEIVINKTGRGSGAEILKAVRALVGEVDEHLTVAGWKEYGRTILAIATTNIVSIWVLWGISMLIVAIFLADTLFSVVEERKREYGSMMSMGLSFRQIAGLFVAEMMVLVLSFVLPGVLLGGLLVGFIATVGIPLPSEVVRSIFGGFDRLYPVLSLPSLAGVFVVLALLTLIISSLAIYKITKLNPVEVLKNE